MSTRLRKELHHLVNVFFWMCTRSSCSCLMRLRSNDNEWSAQSSWKEEKYYHIEKRWKLQVRKTVVTNHTFAGHKLFSNKLGKGKGYSVHMQWTTRMFHISRRRVKTCIHQWYHYFVNRKTDPKAALSVIQSFHVSDIPHQTFRPPRARM